MLQELPKGAHTLVISYQGVRRAIGVVGLLLPILLGPVGWLFGVPIQDNMSSYYHTPMRDVWARNPDTDVNYLMSAKRPVPA